MHSALLIGETGKDLSLCLKTERKLGARNYELFKYMSCKLARHVIFTHTLVHL